MKELSFGYGKTLSWCNDLELEAINQIENLSKLPFLFKHAAVMPDCHSGYGMPIGGVLATKGVVIPNAVGVDIGCGMHLLKFDVKDISTDTLKKIMKTIRGTVPVGFNHRQAVEVDALPSLNTKCLVGYKIVKDEFNNARTQIGTLGGGNHFIEIQKGSDGFIYAMIHSGSRNLGLKVAKHYNELAKELNGMWHTSVPSKADLAFLPEGTEEACQYLDEMLYCLEFAKANRKLMAWFIESAFLEHGFNKIDEHDIHHNYVAKENHFGENVWVHRKGATRAYENEIGIIPGSQGTSSYIVKGKGNILSFKSCSHGSGRKMSRGKAIANLDLKYEQERLDKKGILHSIRSKNDLDEAAGSYKDIDKVMSEQSDLVDIVVKLEPMGVIKG
jgi:tRNA-splicing ligase RtcB